ncbi:ABC transporter permease [Tolumonas lignilytica]|uniref:ABC transporter permease n=1 Tax=Tolumonas lignilytica TaxID=1283284 RepID=UPI00046723CD|nr:ABC transporter permease [Tolumonas lignilytica]
MPDFSELSRLFAGSDVLSITLFTLSISLTATLISVFLGVPTGILLATHQFRGKKILCAFLNFGMGLPPVVVGLIVSLIFWRYGPLGFLNLMYTPSAIIIVQTIVATPIVASLSFSAICSLNEKLYLQLLSLGATPLQAIRYLMHEARIGLVAAVIAGFGRIVSEVGASMMVGGNIKGQTRVLATATVLEVGKGNYGFALMIGAILLLVTFLVVWCMTYLQYKSMKLVRIAK